jgi:hypothetical protein
VSSRTPGQTLDAGQLQMVVLLKSLVSRGALLGHGPILASRRVLQFSRLTLLSPAVPAIVILEAVMATTKMAARCHLELLGPVQASQAKHPYSFPTFQSGSHDLDNIHVPSESRECERSKRGRCPALFRHKNYHISRSLQSI